MSNIPLSIFEETRFVVELGLAIYPVFFMYFQKKKQFWLRFILPLFAIIGIAISYVFFFKYITGIGNFGFTIVFSIFWYLLLTMLIFAHSMLCFELNVNDGLLFTIGGYSIQHLSLIFANEYVRFVLYPEIANNLFLYFLICLGTTCAIYAPYMLLVYYMNRNRTSILGQRRTTTTFLIFLLVMLYSSTFFFQNYFRTYTTDSIIVVISLTGDAFMSFMMAMVIFLVERSSLEKKEREFMEVMYEKEKSQYEAFNGNVEYINVRLHDLKYELKKYADDGMISSGTYEDMTKSIRAYEGKISTGNEMMDFILTDVSYRCQGNDISFSPMVDGKLLDMFERYDLYVLMSNIFDNAITYVKELPKEKRYIKFVVERRNDFLTIRQSNFLADESSIKIKADGTLTTTKKDRKIHGYGTKSIKLFASKYKGSAQFNIGDNEFVLSMTFAL